LTSGTVQEGAAWARSAAPSTLQLSCGQEKRQKQIASWRCYSTTLHGMEHGTVCRHPSGMRRRWCLFTTSLGQRSI